MNGNHVWIIVRKELRGLYSEKTIILAIFLQLFVAMFSAFLMVGLTAMYDPAAISRFSTAEYGVGYAGSDSALLEYLEESPDFRVYRMDLSEAVASLKERKVSAVLYVPDTPPQSDDPVKVTLYLIQNDLQTAVIETKLRDVLVKFEDDLRAARADRLDTRPAELHLPPARPGGGFFEFVYGLLVPLLVFLPAIVASALVIDLITEEFQYRTLETLVSTPISFREIVAGKILACELLVPLQGGAWLLLLSANGIPVLHVPEILLHASAASLILILLAAIAALHYRERSDAQFVFSAALVVVLLLVLALPGNPLAILARLAVGAAGAEHWLSLAVLLLCSGALAAIVHHRTRSG
ncbi:MAG: ABC transporter permease [Methanomicrobiales archaeon]|nr:ABC transporter permease [Methanomicrobiales archaeon]MDI6876135.1 ABC transporter permease [Methanomicrobiales archaeon]